LDKKVKHLHEKRELAKLGGGEARLESQHKKGKLTARERLHFLLDEGSFEEIGMFVTHRSTDFGMEKEKYDGWHYQWALSICIFSRFYRVWWLFIGNTLGENLQNNGDGYD